MADEVAISCISKNSYKLTAEAVEFACQQLALRIPAQTIAEEIKDRFDIDISHQAISQKLKSKRWVPIIDRYREEFQKSVEHIDAADKAHRLAVCSKMIRAGLRGHDVTITLPGGTIKSYTEHNYLIAAKGVELAQKELGITGGSGGSTVNVGVNVQIGKEELAKRQAENLRRGMEQYGLLPVDRMVSEN